MLSHPKTARNGNLISSFGMLVAIIATLAIPGNLNWMMIVIGILVGSIVGAFFAIRVQMTQMPQLVAIFNGFGGAASALVACSEFLKINDGSTFAISLSIIVGTLTFTGSFIAFGKLQGFISGQPITFTGQQIFNALLALILIGSTVMMIMNIDAMIAFYVILGLAALLGILLVIPIGGADMPVVISLLNSYSGIAAAMTGFVLYGSSDETKAAGSALIICGSLVGASGMILTQIMCKGMNRSLTNVIFGAVGGEVREIADFLEEKGKTVLYAIHPVAGRMPGHMNVLLAEANIPYESLKDLDEINSEFKNCDVALVLGANDVVNPAARTDKSSPIYGMPILNVDQSQTVIINKRTMNTGFAGIQNELFGNDNSIMVFGDAKDMLVKLLSDLKEL